MSFINITNVYTADPGDIWTAKNAFMLNDPFAIVLNIQADSSLVSEGLLFDGVFQILGPQQDPANGFLANLPCRPRVTPFGTTSAFSGGPTSRFGGRGPNTMTRSATS